MAPLRATLQGHPLIDGRARRDERVPGPGLYLHVPFCRVRCPYCDFATAPYGDAAALRFVRAVGREVGLLAPRLSGVAFATLSLGGGTPSRLGPGDFAALAAAVEGPFEVAPEAERSLEANPEDVEPARLTAWAAAGWSRVSLGVQSFDGRELARLGRPHDPGLAERAAAEIRSRFASWSCDLLFAFPGHTLASWEASLARALALGPPHLSLYHFTAEPGTVLGDAVRGGRVRAPSEDEAAAFFDLGVRRLGAAGYEHYEISNFARPGHRSRHNELYWRRGDCLGLGPAAVSTWGSWRWTNARDAARYADGILEGHAWLEDVEDLSGQELREIFLVGLRLADGVPWERLAVHGGEAERWRRGALRLASEGLLVADERGARVPSEHRRLTDSIVLRLWSEVESGRGAGLPSGSGRGG